MTPNQRSVYNAIRDLTVDGVSPSIREIAAHVGMGNSGVMVALERLLADGMVTRSEGRHRSLRVIGHFDETAIRQMSHSDLLALRTLIDRRLCA